MKKILMLTILIAMGLVALQACKKDDALTREEAQEALAEAQASTQSQALTMDVLEISTDFTIGKAVEEAAEELRAFAESQIPCSTVSREGAEVTIDFGELEDTCVFKGRTYAGVVTVEMTKTDGEELEVLHSWEGLTNGVVTVNGGATVLWNRSEGTRRVIHQVEWTKGELSGTGEGDRVQNLLDRTQGLKGGIEINGERAWTGARGAWKLDIDGVQLRGQDPVPQSGTYTLQNPEGKELSMTFERLDESTIEVQISGGRRDFAFQVRSED